MNSGSEYVSSCAILHCLSVWSLCSKVCLQVFQSYRHLNVFMCFNHSCSLILRPSVQYMHVYHVWLSVTFITFCTTPTQHVLILKWKNFTAIKEVRNQQSCNFFSNLFCSPDSFLLGATHGLGMRQQLARYSKIVFTMARPSFCSACTILRVWERDYQIGLLVFLICSFFLFVQCFTDSCSIMW